MFRSDLFYSHDEDEPMCFANITIFRIKFAVVAGVLSLPNPIKSKAVPFPLDTVWWLIYDWTDVVWGRCLVKSQFSFKMLQCF